MNQDASQLLVSLDKLKAVEKVEIYIPSLGRAVQFNPLTVKQQKDILKSAFDTKTSTLLFTETLNNIIAEAAIEKANFNIIDKQIIALHFKKAFFTGKTFGKKGDQDVSVDLDSHLNSIPQTPTPPEILSKDIQVSTLSVACAAPTLAYETTVTAESRKIVATLAQDRKEENLKEIVGELFIHEILKFVKTIKYTFNNEPVTVDLTTMPLKDKVTIFENLGVTVNNKIIDYIKTVRTEEKRFLNAGDVALTIDPALFNKTE